jgi:putative transposon-encoded protein
MVNIENFEARERNVEGFGSSALVDNCSTTYIGTLR